MTRVALVHDWLTGMRGGERCLEAMLALFPDAELFTLLHRPGAVSPRIEACPIHTSFVQRLPRAARFYRHYLPLFPAAAERFDLRGYELVVSISHCVAKGVRPPPGVPHLCYCLTPMRYVWDLYDAYFGPERAGPLVRAVMPALARRLRRWDVRSTARAHRLVACSHYVAERIRRCYGREAPVVYPPVEVERFRPAERREDFYLAVSALVPYKRIELAVEAFNRLERRLVVVGTGPELPRLRRAAGRHVTFLGWLGDAEVAEWYGRCRACVFPTEDEFGITAVEAQAAGAPVIAYARGGAAETVLGASEPPGAGERPTGVFFCEPSAESLMQAVLRFERLPVFEVAALQRHARRFSVAAFQAGIRAQVEGLLGGEASALRPHTARR